MDNLGLPLSKESTSSAVAAAGETAKDAAKHHGGSLNLWHRHSAYYWKRGGFVAAGAFVVVPVFGGYLASAYSSAKDKEDPWVKALKTPSWTLPESMMGPIWSACYTTMGVSSFLVWRHGGGFSGNAKIPLLLYSGQLALNLAWIPIFYKSKSLKVASVAGAAATALATAATMSFHKVLPAAAYIMTPYVLWMLYETALTISMSSLNKSRKD